jgi:hypothetical protein
MRGGDGPGRLHHTTLGQLDSHGYPELVSKAVKGFATNNDDNGIA